MMSTFAGTGRLVGLTLRLDRVRLPVWVFAIAVLPGITASNYQSLYPTDAEIDQVAGIIANPALVAVNGRLFHPSLGALTTWKVLLTEVILAALMSVLTVVRHTRAEEESGLSELLRTSGVGRSAQLTAALLTVAGANAAVVALVAVGLLVVGLPVQGSLALAWATGLGGFTFAAIAAVAAQLTTSARSATGLAMTVLGLCYGIRAIGDTGPTWLTWLSPLGWTLNLRAFAEERWLALLPLVVLATLATALAYALNGRRDLQAGYLPRRPGPARASPWLRSPLALAWRLHRASLVGWAVGLAIWGTALGGIAKGVEGAVGTNQKLVEVLARLGGESRLIDSYLAAVFGITALVASGFAVQAVTRPYGEEIKGRIEPLLATAVGRIQLAASHLAVALVGTAALLVVTGGCAGLSYGVATGSPSGQVLRVLGCALVQVPATWVLAGLGMALYGLAPHLSALTWAGLIVCALMMELGALTAMPQWAMNISPFTHTPRLPATEFTATGPLWLILVAAGLMGAGLVGFRRRDIA